jgi:hypothetical protein
MAAPNPAATDAVRSIRREERPMGEELNSETRHVQSPGRGNSKAINLTKYASDTLDIEVGDEMVVRTFHDQVVIEPKGDDESE